MSSCLPCDIIISLLTTLTTTSLDQQSLTLTLTIYILYSTQTDGSTGSGKSFTMTGERSAPGVIPRAITEIFNLIKQTQQTDADVHFLVRMSYVELYNNNFRNLLEFASKDLPNSQQTNGHYSSHHVKKLSADDLREDLKGSKNGQHKSHAKRHGSFDRSSLSFLFT